MKNVFAGIMLFAMSAYSYAALIETTLTCRVESIWKQGDVQIAKGEVDDVTVDLIQFEKEFLIRGTGKTVYILGSNSSRNKKFSSMVDRTTTSKFNVEFVYEDVDSTSGRISLEKYTLILDRVTGSLYSTQTWRSIRDDANLVIQGNCQKANKKF
jgi:hypothetical protein